MKMKLAVFCGNQSDSSVESASSGGYKKSLVNLWSELIKLDHNKINCIAKNNLLVNAKQFLILRIFLQQIEHHKQTVFDNNA